MNLPPSVSVILGAGWSFSIASTFYWRQGTGDGIYDNSGNLVRGDGGSKARYIGTQSKLCWSTSSTATCGFSCRTPSSTRVDIKDTGPSKTVHFIGTDVEFRF
jgi:hypothetical protein